MDEGELQEDQLSEDLYYVLVDKSEGEAALRVNSAPAGDGITANQKLYLWFAGTSELALQERTRITMSPGAAKKDEDVADQIEKWLEQVRLLEQHGDEYVLNHIQNHCSHINYEK